MFNSRFSIIPPDPPNEGIMFANMQQWDRSGHLGHALVEYEPGKILAFFANCSAEDQQWKGHSGYGWMEYRRSVDGGETWSEPMFEPHSKALFDQQTGRTLMCEKAVCTDTGRIVLFYLTCDVETNGHIWEPYFAPYYAFSEDGGETFTELKMFTDRPGRVFDALYQDGVIYVMYHDSDYSWKNEETQMQLWVSEEVKAMPCWPDYGSVKAIDDTMVIKFQEYSE